MQLADMIGTLAAIASTSAFFPQALRVILTRDTHAISLGMYTLIFVGILLWGAYGVMTRQWPIILSNVVTFVPAVIILGMKVRDTLRDGAKAQPEA
jgi:MtN3 and saliva related transmembrane protein